jgi:small subunit ribosomal protein S20
MPITKSAIKKQRSDKKKAGFNKSTKTKAKTAIDAFKLSLSKESLMKAFSMVDKAAKKGVIKKGKANRIKSRLSKKVSSKA